MTENDTKMLQTIAIVIKRLGDVTEYDVNDYDLNSDDAKFALTKSFEKIANNAHEAIKLINA
jgi:hypothetical protein